MDLIRILVVEDEQAISSLIALSLKQHGYVCDCAGDGLAAADMLENGQYDLVLLDVMLPELSGFDLMEMIRPLEIPVIFLTARNAVEDRVKGLRMGAEDYIVKPFAVMELLARVEVVLRRHRKGEDCLTVGGLRIDPRSMQVWGGDLEYGSKAVDLAVQRLRKKLGWTDQPRAISGVGYRLEVEE